MMNLSEFHIKHFVAEPTKRDVITYITNISPADVSPIKKSLFPFWKFIPTATLTMICRSQLTSNPSMLSRVSGTSRTPIRMIFASHFLCATPIGTKNLFSHMGWDSMKDFLANRTSDFKRISLSFSSTNKRTKMLGTLPFYAPRRYPEDFFANFTSKRLPHISPTLA
jgi:hypothetical protein